MKKILSTILICILVTACRSQKILSGPSNFSANKNQNEYFSGSWKLMQKNYKDGNQIKEYPLHKCMKEYELVFTDKNKSIFLTKVFATGENCKIKSRSDEFLITITNGSFQYREYDIKKYEQYKIYSENKFSVIYNDIINGKVTQIEDIYQKQ